ncbi:CPSF A subunit region-domain-containing protein [Lentinula edodes]|nr:CPSF A subunit region-domain-containing protein [Lentinula edodes]
MTSPKVKFVMPQDIVSTLDDANNNAHHLTNIMKSTFASLYKKYGTTKERQALNEEHKDISCNNCQARGKTRVPIITRSRLMASMRINAAQYDQLLHWYEHKQVPNSRRPKITTSHHEILQSSTSHHNTSTFDDKNCTRNTAFDTTCITTNINQHSHPKETTGEQILPTSQNGPATDISTAAIHLSVSIDDLEVPTTTTTLSSISELDEIRPVPETDSQNLGCKEPNAVRPSLATTTDTDISHNNNSFYDHPAEDFWTKSIMRPPNLSISQKATRAFTTNHNQGNDLTSPYLQLLFIRQYKLKIQKIQFMDTAETVAYVPPVSNEAAFSLAVVPFLVRGCELQLIVMTAANTTMSPRPFSSDFLQTYDFTNEGRSLRLLQKTETDDVPLTLSAFQIHDIGKKNLLRKVENKGNIEDYAMEGTLIKHCSDICSAHLTLNTQGLTIILREMQHSVCFVAYKTPENHLLLFGDDSQSKWVSALMMVKYSAVAIGVRFDNIILNRLITKESDQVDEDPTGADCHIGDLVTSIHKVEMVAGGREILLYTGVHGTVGILVPFVSKEDVDFVSTLERHLLTEQRLFGWQKSVSWRGYYTPVKPDDLCETFARLPRSKQNAITSELNRTVGEVFKKLDRLSVTTSEFPHDTEEDIGMFYVVLGSARVAG